MQWLWTYNNNDRPDIGIGSIKSAQKLKMAAQVLRTHPLKTGDYPDTPNISV